mmetsp:Transcript_19141/g.76697  ORF Transcript_19141/g.76697 Transcript_19141/m.76697 type:complete len:420 (-) Transcript_19141:1436-2695(-)|eukprot:CAMPEP_0113965930 /NCGR_PEP_ID=MMETSP0011_2-20120614/8036_1 /TAXON_ID=101924 /ORGANISM="Rhodosorus marinus" /LENGTH=419 /DNA_ID=CAMNT_0000978533 /DNA_START=63 /DNA_END=1322 /DNA_ORIENTATION=- /assembly_acc=CAM_ASM_000156
MNQVEGFHGANASVGGDIGGFGIRPYKIAVIAWESLHGVAVGSVSVHVSYLAENLVQRGHEVHLFVRRAPEQSEYENINGVHYHRVYSTYDKDFVAEVSNLSHAFVAEVNNAESFMNASFDIMHCHDWMTAPALKILKTMMDRKCIFTMHSTNGIRCGSKTFGSLTNKVIELEQDGVGFCDRVVGVTGPLCDRIKVDYSFDWDKLRCIPYAFPFGEYENDNQGFDVRRKFHWDRNDFLIMYFGLFSPNRNLETLLDAMKLVVKDHHHARLVLVGEGLMGVELQNLANEMEIGHRVVFLRGTQSLERKALYKSAEVVIQPVSSENVGTVCLEAWACQKPVVSTTSSALRELITHQEDGLLVEADAEGLSWAMKYCLQNPENAKKMGNRGFEKLSSPQFSAKRIAELVNNVYDEVHGIYPA